MSDKKQIRLHGMHQEDLVEVLYYLFEQQASIQTYLSTLGIVCSAVFGEFSDATGSFSISLSTSITSFSEFSVRCSFPTSMTALTGVSINLVN